MMRTVQLRLQRGFAAMACRQRYGWRRYIRAQWRGLTTYWCWRMLPQVAAGQKGKTILVIDDWLLRPDDSTLGRANDQYLQQLQKMGWRVFLLLRQAGWDTPQIVPHSTHWDEPYAQALDKRGIPVLASRLFRLRHRAWLQRNAAAIDYVLFRWPDTAMAYLPFFRQQSTAKLLFLAMDLQAERKRREYAITNNAADWQAAQRFAVMEAEIFQAVDGVLTFSHEEGAWLRQQVGEKVFHLPILIYPVMPAARPLPPQGQTMLFVGNFAHSPNRDGVRWFLENCLPMIKQVNPAVKLVIAGALADAAIFAWQSAEVEVVGKVSDAQLTRLYEQARVVIAPLRFGAGVKGKVIEALAHGTPVVTTRFGVEGVPGLEAITSPADSPAAMTAAITRLLTDDDEWQRVSVAGQAFVQQHFSSQAAEQSLRQIFAWVEKSNR
jgi:glycosyltransferase involved in cell wall biosynthesis